jgi:hypothetical protein
MTFLGWIVGGIGLVIGVWLLLAFVDWMGGWGTSLTEEQARKHLDRSRRRDAFTMMLAKKEWQEGFSWRRIVIISTLGAGVTLSIIVLLTRH